MSAGARKDAGALCLDLRGLECPEPLVTVIRAIEGDDALRELHVVFDQDPVFLYPELAGRGWCAETAGPADHGSGIRLRLSRIAS